MKTVSTICIVGVLGAFALACGSSRTKDSPPLAVERRGETSATATSGEIRDATLGDAATAGRPPLPRDAGRYPLPVPVPPDAGSADASDVPTVHP